jgi:alanyl-tRNA synthetase
VSDVREIDGSGWSLDVSEVRKIEGRVTAIGTVTGSPRFEIVKARVPADRRNDAERNHDATHLVHASHRARLALASGRLDGGA